MNFKPIHHTQCKGEKRVEVKQWWHQQKSSGFNTFKLEFSNLSIMLFLTAHSEVRVEEGCFILDGGNKSHMECAGRRGR